MSQPEGTQPQPNPSQGGYTPPSYPSEPQYPQSAQYPQGQYPQGQYPPPQQYPQGQYPTGSTYPPAGQAYPQQPYGQPTQSGQPNQPGYPTQYQPGSYPSQYPTPAAYPTRAAKKNPLLGIIALAVVVLSLVAALVATQPIIAVMSTVVTSAGLEGVDEQYLTELLNEQAAGSSLLFSLSMTLGFAGWVTGIVATAMNRGRGWGIFAIVLGSLAPFIILGVMMALLMPAMANI